MNLKNEKKFNSDGPWGVEVGKRLEFKGMDIDTIEWWILTKLTFYQDSCFFTFVKSSEKWWF